MSELKLPKDYTQIVVMAAEPLKGCTPDEMRRMLCKYKTDEALAMILAGVSNKTGWLHHDLNDPEFDEEEQQRIKEEFHRWWELEKELYAEVIRREKEAGRSVAEEMGLRYAIKPFMERHSFRDGNGWWIDEWGKR